MEEEEERAPQAESEENFDDVAATDEALLDWLAIKDFSYLSAEVHVHFSDVSEMEALHNTIAIMDYAAFWTERSLIREMQIPAELMQALDNTSRRYNLPYGGPRFVVKDVYKGSLIVEGAVVFAIGAVLRHTLGKPAAEAWKSSKSRKALVKAMRGAIDRAGEKFGEILRLQSRETETALVKVRSPKRKAKEINVEIDLAVKKGGAKNRNSPI